MTFQGFEPMWNKSRRVSRMSQSLIIQAAQSGRLTDSEGTRESVARAEHSQQADRNMPVEYMDDEYWLHQPHSELDLKFSDHWTSCWSNSKRDKHVYLSACHELEMEVWDKWRGQKPTGEIVAGMCAVYGDYLFGEELLSASFCHQG